VTDWIEWKGGECPVTEHEWVDVRRRNGFERRILVSRGWDWRHSGRGDDIIAYRIHAPASAEATGGGVTGGRIASIRLTSAYRRPYDVSDDENMPDPGDWAVRAARGVIADMRDRRAIKWGFDNVDQDVRREMIQTVADIIRFASAPNPPPAPDGWRKALDLAVAMLAPYEPGDSRAVSDEFVALASIVADCANDDTWRVIDAALSRIRAAIEPAPAEGGGS